MPSSKEIIEKTNTEMPEGELIPEAVKEKIEAGMKKRDEFMPSSA